MNEYFIDCAALTDRTAAHEYLKRALSLPEYYGHNLDALYDCLTEMSGCIELLDVPAAGQLGEYGQSMLETFRDAARENPMLTVHEHGGIGG